MEALENQLYDKTQVDEYYEDVNPINFRNSLEAMKKNPYPGLRPFRTSENPVFFGRQEICNELIDLLAKHNFLAVIGASGSGKSSLVRAGLLRSLKSIPGRFGSWKIAICRPGTNPFANLARAILEAGIFPHLFFEEILTGIRKSSSGFGELISNNLIDEDEILPFQTLIVIDQFEELFRFKKDYGFAGVNDTALFVKMLIGISEKKNLNTFILLTMRTEFLNNCIQIPGLAEKINKGQFLVPYLSIDQLKDAIINPLAFTGAEIEDGLANKLVGALGEGGDQLPVMQHALRESYRVAKKNSDDGKIILEYKDYLKIGTIHKAINLHADNIYKYFTKDQKIYCKLLFQALTEKTSEGNEIRRPASFLTIQHICAGKRQENLESIKEGLIIVINRFRADNVNFLMPPQTVNLTDETEIDISHESLMRIWDKLKEWTLEESGASGLYKRLRDNIVASKKSDYLAGNTLATAIEFLANDYHSQWWAARYGGSFEKVERHIQASKKNYLVRKWINITVLSFFGLLVFFLFYYFTNREANDKQVVAARQNSLNKQQEKFNDQQKKFNDQQKYNNYKRTLELNTLYEAYRTNDTLHKINSKYRKTLDSIDLNKQPFYASLYLDSSIKTRAVKFLLKLKEEGQEAREKKEISSINNSILGRLTSDDDPNKGLQYLMDSKKKSDNFVVDTMIKNLKNKFAFYTAKKQVDTSDSKSPNSFSYTNQGNLLLRTNKGFNILRFGDNVINLETQLLNIGDTPVFLQRYSSFAAQDSSNFVYVSNKYIYQYDISQRKNDSSKNILKGNYSQFSPDGLTLVSYNYSDTLWIYKKVNNKKWNETPFIIGSRLSNRFNTVIHFSPNSRYLVITYFDSWALIDLKNDNKLVKVNKLINDSNFVPSNLVSYYSTIELSNDTLINLDYFGRVYKFGLESDDLKPDKLPTERIRVLNGYMRISPDNHYLLIAGDDNMARILNLRTFKIMELGTLKYNNTKDYMFFKYKTSPYHYTDAQFLNSNHLLTYDAHSGELRLWDISQAFPSDKLPGIRK